MTKAQLCSLLVITVIAATLNLRASATESVTIDSIRDAHRAGRDAIKTCSCKVEFEIKMIGRDLADIQRCSAECWYSADAVRVKSISDGIDRDSMWRNGERILLTRAKTGGRDSAAAGRSATKEKHSDRCDAWAQGLLALNPPETGLYVSFDELIEKASKVENVERRREAGRELLRVRMLFPSKTSQNDEYTFDVFFDPSVNFLIRKIERRCAARNELLRQEVSEFREFAQGIFFPTEVTQTFDSDGKTWSRATCHISEIHLNAGVPAGVFELTYPTGTVFVDSIRSVSYRVNERGQRVSQEISLQEKPTPPPMKTASVEFGTETTAEPRAPGWWIAPAAIAMLALAALLAAFRKWRDRSSM